VFLGAGCDDGTVRLWSLGPLCGQRQRRRTTEACALLRSDSYAWVSMTRHAVLAVFPAPVSGLGPRCVALTPVLTHRRANELLAGLGDGEGGGGGECFPCLDWVAVPEVLRARRVNRRRWRGGAPTPRRCQVGVSVCAHRTGARERTRLPPVESLRRRSGAVEYRGVDEHRAPRTIGRMGSGGRSAPITHQRAGRGRTCTIIMSSHDASC
jgi:hypothetical protein